MPGGLGARPVCSQHRIAHPRQPGPGVGGDAALALVPSTTHMARESASWEIGRSEEWEHRLYAERDFDVLESRSS